ncbi:MAG: FtsQ-type POTRA domain-containing protein [Armatimonadota bacterium]|nr:FtsQ-type POTRA domain-containing protein [Armatimonadota bacterium]MDW8156924.1 FtsQ-type POTRA domain-containing protein [Armatimonadota bacterium]
MGAWPDPGPFPWARLLRLWAAVAGTCAVLSFPSSAAFSLQEVEVHGARRLDARELARAGGLEVGMPLASVDPDRVRRRLLRLPRVRDAWVQARWPSRVRVWVDERTPQAVLRLPDGTEVLVDEDGVVLDGAAQGLPVVLGPKVRWLQPGEAVPAPEVVRLVRELAALPDPDRQQVAWARPLATGDVTVGTRDGLVVRAAAGRLGKGLRTAREVAQALWARGVRAGVVDVRYADRAVVQPAP